MKINFEIVNEMLRFCEERPAFKIQLDKIGQAITNNDTEIEAVIDWLVKSKGLRRVPIGGKLKYQATVPAGKLPTPSTRSEHYKGVK